MKLRDIEKEEKPVINEFKRNIKEKKGKVRGEMYSELLKVMDFFNKNPELFDLIEKDHFEIEVKGTLSPDGGGGEESNPKLPPIVKKFHNEYSTHPSYAMGDPNIKLPEGYVKEDELKRWIIQNTGKGDRKYVNDQIKVLDAFNRIKKEVIEDKAVQNSYVAYKVLSYSQPIKEEELGF